MNDDPYALYNCNDVIRNTTSNAVATQKYGLNGVDDDVDDDDDDDSVGLAVLILMRLDNHIQPSAKVSTDC